MKLVRLEGVGEHSTTINGYIKGDVVVDFDKVTHFAEYVNSETIKSTIWFDNGDYINVTNPLSEICEFVASFE